MNIIVTSGWFAKGRPLFIGPIKLAFILILLVLFSSSMGIGLYLAYEYYQKGHMKLDYASQQRLLRGNIDTMAKKVGEMQAKLIELDYLTRRVVNTAGLDSELESGNREEVQNTVTGQGGLLTRAQVLDAKDLQQLIEDLEIGIQNKADILLLAEAHLSENKLAKITIPNEYPVSNQRISSGFGWRIDPFTGRRALHTGTDFAARRGTPIFAAAAGVVIARGRDGGYGEIVEIDHGDGVITRYAHTSRQYVKVGDLVLKGQHIADIGSTGRSTGPHLHFEVIVDGVQVNPMRFLRKNRIGVASR